MKPKKKAKKCRGPAQFRYAVIYCRVSTHEQVANTSLARQEDECKRWCEQRGIEVARVFVEEGESAKSADRTQLQMLISYCESHDIDVVVFYAFDRYARDIGDHFGVKARLAAFGTAIRSVTQPTDESSSGIMLEGMAAVYGHVDNAKRRENTIGGMKGRIDRGGWPFDAALGYRKVKHITRRTTLEQDPDVAPLIRQAFTLMATGAYRVVDVADMMKRAGLRSRKGRVIDQRALGKMLRRPVYKGRLIVEPWGKNVDGGFDPIVSPEVFDRVQQVLDGRTVTATVKNRSNPDFPLRVFVKCACGTSITGSKQKGRYSYYKCPKCRGTSITKETLEADFLRLVADMQPRRDLRDVFRRVVAAALKQRQESTVRAIQAARGAATAAKDEQSQLLTLLCRGVLSEARWREEDGRLTAKINEAEATADAAMRDLHPQDDVFRFAEWAAENAADLWTHGDLARRQRLQTLLFPQGLVLRNGRLETELTSLFFEGYGQINPDSGVWWTRGDSNP